MDIADINFVDYKKLNNEKSLELFAPKPFLNGDSCPYKNKAPFKRATDVLQAKRDRLDKLVNPYPKSVQSLFDQRKKLGFNYQDAVSKISGFDKSNTINSALSQFKNLGLSSKVGLIDKPFHDLTKNNLAHFKASQIDMAHLKKLGYKRELINNHFGGFEAFKLDATKNITNRTTIDSFAKIENIAQLKLRDISCLSTNRAIDSINKINTTFGLDAKHKSIKIEELLNSAGGSKNLLLTRSSALNSALKDIQGFKEIRNSFIHSGVIPSLAEDTRIKNLFSLENDTLAHPDPDLLIPPRNLKDNKEKSDDLLNKLIELKEEVSSLQSGELTIVNTVAKRCMSINPNIKRPSRFSPTETIRSDAVYYAVECTLHFQSVNGCLPTSKELWTFIKNSIRSNDINIAGLTTSLDESKNNIKVEDKSWDEENCRKFHKQYFE